MTVDTTTASQGLRRPQRLVLRVAGAGLLAATAAIHLDLYLTGYRTIPAIGWLFLLQVVAAFVLAVAVLAWEGSVVDAAGAGFAVATLGGYLLSVWVGLFGFTEVRNTAGITAGIIEIAAFATLATLALTPAAGGQPARSAGGGPVLAWLRAGIAGVGWLVAAGSLIALAVLGVSLAQAGGPAPAAPGGLKTATIHGLTVLTNARGFTLYWFAPDTPTRSNCTGTCAAYWPPATGTPVAGPGVTGKVGTIKRADGTIQATYNGHPLYTYIGDTAPGQAHGNGLNLNGGLWHETTTSSRPAAQARQSASLHTEQLLGAVSRVTQRTGTADQNGGSVRSVKGRCHQRRVVLADPVNTGLAGLPPELATIGIRGARLSVRASSGQRRTARDV